MVVCVAFAVAAGSWLISNYATGICAAMTTGWLYFTGTIFCLPLKKMLVSPILLPFYSKIVSPYKQKLIFQRYEEILLHKDDLIARL